MIENIGKGKYKITVECGSKGNRKRTSKTINGSKIDAKILETEMINNIKNNNYTQIKNNNLTFKELANKFLEDYCKNQLKENTINTYNNYLKIILKELGSLLIKNITSYTLQCFYNKLKNEYNLNQNTIRYYYILIDNILNKGVQWQLIKENNNKLIKKPKLEKKEINIYNYEQLKQLMQALDEEEICHKAFILLCVDTGMRRGEICGLKWENINFNTREISILEERVIVGKKVIVTTPKTIKSKRTIIATETSIQCLKELKEYQEKMANQLKNKWKNNDNYVFVTNLGKPYYPSRLLQIFKDIQKRHNLPELTIHELRHTSASLLINNNEDITSVSTRLGHSNILTTLNIYTHEVKKSNIRVANTMENILTKN